MGENSILITAIIVAAGWVTVALGGDFNACHVTYDYDGTLLVNGERFFPVGTHFLPPGEPDQTPAPSIEDAYAAYAANGGNILIGPRYYNMYNTPDVYGVHGLPSDLYYDQGKCVDHLNAANAAGVKVMTCPHIYWWWDAEYTNEEYPGLHPIWAAVAGNWGWHIDQPTQEERFSGLEPNGGIKGWVENGDSAAFMGWHHWYEPEWACWLHKFEGIREYPRPPGPTPTAAKIAETYGWLRALEDDPAVDADHPTFNFGSVVARAHDMRPEYFASAEIVGCNPVPVPEPYISYYRDQGENPTSWLKDGMFPNYHCAMVGDIIDAFYEVVSADKPVLCVVQNHWLQCLPWSELWAEPTAAQYRFMTYDSIIHRANGVIYGHQSFGHIRKDTGAWEIFGQLWEPCKPTFNEIGRNGLMHDALKGEYDNLLVEVTTTYNNNVVEKSVFIGGDLAPKNHFLSDQILMEGCAKKHGGYTYLIVACREGVDQFEPPIEPIVYDVTFRPYFSSKTPWTGTMEVVGEGRSIPISAGTFTDEFEPEEVHIYKFVRPAPYAGE